MNGDPRQGRGLIKLLAALTVASLVIAGWAFLSRFQETNQLRADQTHAWHAVICTIELAVLKDRKMTPAAKRHALKFYDKLLIVDINTTGCGLVPPRT